MKMKKPTLCLFLLLIGAGLTAQQQFKLGKTTVLLPETPIRVDDRGYAMHKNYVKIVNDTLYYYETAKSSGSDRFFDEVEIKVFPLKSLEYKYMTVERIITEHTDGKIETEFHIWISMKYEDRKKNTAWVYTINKNGNMKKKKDNSFIIYSDSRDIFDELKSKYASQTTQ
jgi:hypothetical protein